MVVRSSLVVAHVDAASCLPDRRQQERTPLNARRPLANGQSFPKSARLLNQGAFKPVFDNPSYRAANRHGLLLARVNQQDHSRLGLVIAKKHVRRAVDRNRIKRCTREYFRLHALTQHCDIVFLARAGIQLLDNREVDALVARLWQKLEAQFCQG